MIYYFVLPSFFPLLTWGIFLDMSVLAKKKNPFFSDHSIDICKCFCVIECKVVFLNMKYFPMKQSEEGKHLTLTQWSI